MLFSWKIGTFNFELGIETDQHTQFLQIYKLPQVISTPGLIQKREVVHLSLINCLLLSVNLSQR